MEHEKKSNNKLYFLYGIAIVAALAAFIALVMMSCGNMSTTEETPDESSASSTVVEDTTEPEPEAEEVVEADPTDLDLAREANADTVGWLTVTGTDIDNPLMQSVDNSYYLNRDELGEYDGWGCYFADYYANLTNADTLIQNTVIYGHAQNPENADGVKFSQLFRYLEQDFLEENPYIYLTVGQGDTEETLAFEIFAVFYTGIDFYYINPSPSSDGFDTFIDTVLAKSEYIFSDADITEDDKLLTLSTCSHLYDTEDTGNQRLVVMAKLVDSDSGTGQTITANPDPVRP